MSTTKSAYGKARWKRFGLYACRAGIWLVIGFALEFGTSIFADGLNNALEKLNIWGIVGSIGVAVIAFLINLVKARKVHPIYSMDNDLNTGLFVLFAMVGPFLDNCLAGSICLDGVVNTTKYVIGVVICIFALFLMLIDIKVIDRFYEKINGISHIEFQYKMRKLNNGNVQNEKADKENIKNYIMVVLKVNVAWIIVPVVALIACGIWIILVYTQVIA